MNDGVAPADDPDRSLAHLRKSRSRLLWVVTGGEKAPMLARLVNGDESIPAGRVRRERALAIADAAAKPGLCARRGRKLRRQGGRHE